MKSQNRNIGRLGEAAAEEFLVKNGMETILKNFSTRFGEIDLIMRDKDVSVFVEVKTKKGAGWGTPEEMFTRGKYEKVKRMATVYLEGRDVPCRIDMVAVELDVENRLVEVRHYQNVYH